MKRTCTIGIVLITMWGGFLRCASSKSVTATPPANVNPTASQNTFPQTFTLSGTVRNEKGELLANAGIQLLNGPVTQTDESGRFSITTEVKEPGDINSMFVSYAGLVTAVRSYHAAMQNADYAVTLHPPVECCIKTECFISPVTVLAYPDNHTEINAGMEAMLLPLVDSLKEHPFCNLRFIAYGKGNRPGSRADERLRQIKAFFTAKGITESRILTLKMETRLSDEIEVDVMRE